MQSFIVEDRRYRTVRAWPVWSGERGEWLVTELGHEVHVDGINFDTAPIKNGVTFSLLGISMDENTIEAGLHQPTDRLATKASLEDVYIRIGQQIYRHHLDLPYSRSNKNNYRVLEVDTTACIELNDKARDKDGAILSLLEPFTSAGVRVQMSVKLMSTINLELADTTVVGQAMSTHSVFPQYKSFQDHDVRSSIHQDIQKFMMHADVLGFTVDIDRKNLLNPDLKLRNHSPVSNPEVAATILAARYGQTS